MSSEVSITLTGDAARLVGELQRVVGKFSELEGGAKGVAEAYKADARAARDLERDAKRAWESTRTPQEQHIERIRRAEQFIGKAGFTQKDYARYVKQSEERMRELESRTKGAADANDGVFGSSALGKLTSYAAGMLSIGSAVGAVVSGLNEIQRIGDEAAQKQIGARIGLGSLAQVATSTEDFQQLKAKAEGVYKAGAAGSMDEASQLVFALRSAGQDDSLDLMTQLRSTGVVADPAAMVKAATTLQTSMGIEETGGMRDMVSKAFGASAFSPATAEALLEASARSGTGAKAMGLTDEEILAATAVTATATGSAERGGTQVAALLRSIEKIGAAGSGDKAALASAFGGEDEGAIPGLSAAVEKTGIKFDKKDNLMQRIEKIQAAGLSNAEMMELFGREESIDAFRALVGQKDLYGKALAGTRAAQEGDLVSERIKMVQDDPALLAAKAGVQAAAELEMSRTDEGTLRNLSDTVLARQRVERERDGIGFGTMAAGKASEFFRWMMPGGEANIVAGGIKNQTLTKEEALSAIARPDVQEAYRGILGPNDEQRMKGVDTTEEFKAAISELYAAAKNQNETSKATASRAGFGPDRALSKPDIDR